MVLLIIGDVWVERLPSVRGVNIFTIFALVFKEIYIYLYVDHGDHGDPQSIHSVRGGGYDHVKIFS